MPKPILRRVLTTLLALIIPLLTFAYDFKVDGIYYNIIDSSNKTVKVTFGDNSYSLNYDKYKYTGIVKIPGSVTYNGTTYCVNSIGNEAFYSCDGLTSVTIPNSIISIGDRSFCGCTGLTSVTIPDSIIS